MSESTIDMMRNSRDNWRNIAEMRAKQITRLTAERDEAREESVTVRDAYRAKGHSWGRFRWEKGRATEGEE